MVHRKLRNLLARTSTIRFYARTNCEKADVQNGAKPMKRLLSIIAISLLLWPACSTEQKTASQNEKRETETARQEREEFQGKVEAQLRDLDREIDALRAKMGKPNKVRRKQVEKQMAELERKREAAQEEFEKLQNSSQEAWKDMKVGIDAAMEDLETAYKQAASHFK